MTGAAAAESARGRAGALLFLGIAILSLQDSLIKLVSPETSFWQFQALRSVLNLAILLVLARAYFGMQVLRVKDMRAVAVRSLFLTACMFCFFAGAPKLSFAQMGTGLFTYPMWVTLLSGLVLREPVGPWRLGAVAVSAAGAALILKPWSAEFSPWQVLPVLAGLLYAANVLTLRRWCQGEHPMALAGAVGVAFLASGLLGIAALSLFPAGEAARAAMPFVVLPWPELTLSVIGFVVVASLCNLSGNISLARAYQSAEPSWLAPFDYTYLGFVVLWGFVVFGDLPDGQTIFGVVMIATAGVVTALREVRRQPRFRRRGPMR